MRFLVGFAVGLLLLAFGVWSAATRGLLPAAANDPSFRWEPLLADAGLAARISLEAPRRDVSALSTADLLAGADVYQKNCALCHALPNQPQGPVGAGMFPKAPRLLSPDGMVSDDPAGETYWKIKNGIRLSGMASFGRRLTEDQMWQVAALVKRADSLPPEVLDALEPTAPPQGAATK